MSVWDLYESRIETRGGNKRNASHIRECRAIERHLKDSLSYQVVEMFPAEYGYNIDEESSSKGMFVQNVAIIDSDNLNEKYIYSLPREDIVLGSLIIWRDNYWLVTERDANTTVYTRAKLLQCNYLLKWVTDDNKIISQWCVIEDGTKYLTGEYEDRDFVVTRGDTRISVQLAKTKYSSILDRNNRFLIDDNDSPRKLAYRLSKPFKMGTVFGGEGTFKFVLQEVASTEYDNHELSIADYYRHFPEKIDDNITSGGEQGAGGKKVWI